MSGMKFALAILALFLLFTLSVRAHMPALSQDIIEQQQKARLEQAQQQRESLRTPLSIAPLHPIRDKDAGYCQRIRRIEFINADSLSAGVKAELIKPYLDRCLTMAAIGRLQRAASNAYLTRGFITSQVLLAPQDLTRGTLTLTASEGRIESISLAGESPRMLASAFPALTGRVLNLRDLEQGLEQLNRLPSRQMTVDIQPGTRAGYSAVVLKYSRHRLPLSATFSIDNSGQKSSGSGQLNASLALDNPLQLADRWQIFASHNSDFSSSHHSRALNGALTLPWGWWLLSIQGSWSEQLQSISTRRGRWRYRGENVSQRVNVNRTLFRNEKTKLAADVGLSHRRIRTHLAGIKLGYSSPELSVLHFGGNVSTLLAGGYLTLNPLVSQGTSLLGAGSDGPAQPGGPGRSFTKYTLSASYGYPLNEHFSYLTSAFGQATPHNLHASERISIGGQYSVRGYKEQYLSGNQGAYWRNELNWQWRTLPGLGSVSATAALDGGWLDGERRKINGGTLSGGALGVAAKGRWIAQSFSVAKPLTWPQGLNPDRWVVNWQTGIVL